MDPAELSELLTEDELLASLTEAQQGMRAAHAEWMRHIERRRKITIALFARKVTYARIAAHLGITEGAISQYMKPLKGKRNDG